MITEGTLWFLATFSRWSFQATNGWDILVNWTLRLTAPHSSASIDTLTVIFTANGPGLALIVVLTVVDAHVDSIDVDDLLTCLCLVLWIKVTDGLQAALSCFLGQCTLRW